MLRVFHIDSDTSVAAGLADVKSQIEADQRARAMRAHTI